jgi:hypothetical protein
VKPLQAVPAGSTKVKAFAVTLVVVELKVAAVPLRLNPCEAERPCAVEFTVAVWPLQVIEETAVEACSEKAKTIKQRSLFMNQFSQ